MLLIVKYVVNNHRSYLMASNGTLKRNIFYEWLAPE